MFLSAIHQDPTLAEKMQVCCSGPLHLCASALVCLRWQRCCVCDADVCGGDASFLCLSGDSPDLVGGGGC
eukprot:3266844-Rhodomonas_salina.1